MRDGPDAKASAGKNSAGIVVLLGLAIFFVYAPVVHHPFLVTDDPEYVTRNTQVLRGLTLPGIRWACTTFEASNWHPLTWISHMFDVELFALDARGHHAVNVVLHFVNTTLLYGFMSRATGKRWKSAFVAAFFAVHPLHVESVAWVAERKDVLSTSFALLTLAAYARYAARPAVGRYLRVVACFTLGLLAKPMLVTLPCLLLLLDFWPLARLRGPAPSRTVSRLVVEKVPLFGLAALSSLLTILAQKSGGAVVSTLDIPFALRATNAVVSCATYLFKTIIPRDLAVLYPHPGAALPFWKIGAAGFFLTLVTVTVIAQAARGRRPWLATGWFWYVGTLVPVLGLVQVGAQGMADRYTYLPLVGIFLILAWSLPNLPPPAAALRRGAALLAVAVLAVLARAQVGYWSGSIPLFSHAVAVTPPNWSARFGLGVAFEQAGRTAEAIEQYREAVRLNPDSADAHYNLGSLLGARGNLDEGIVELHQAARLNPALVVAQANLGYALMLSGRLDEAITVLRAALARNQDVSDLHVKLGQALERRGEREEAWRHYREAVRLSGASPRGPGLVR
jgi:Flp pilus assembly protein TadD